METAINNFESLDGKPFEWIEHEGKRYANQKQFAELLGIKPQNLRRWINKHRLSMPDLITLPRHNQNLYPYELVCIVDFKAQFREFI